MIASRLKRRITKQGLEKAVIAGMRAFIGAKPGHVDILISSSLAKRIVGEVSAYLSGVGGVHDADYAARKPKGQP